MIAFRRPNRKGGSRKIRPEGLRRSPGSRRDPYFCGTGIQTSADLSSPIRQPFAIGRELRTSSSRSQEPCGMAQGGVDVQAAAVPVGAVDPLCAIRGEGGFVIIGGIVRELNRFTAPYLLYKDIEIALAGAVGSIRHQFAIAGNGGELGQTHIVG